MFDFLPNVEGLYNSKSDKAQDAELGSDYKFYMVGQLPSRNILASPDNLYRRDEKPPNQV